MSEAIGAALIALAGAIGTALIAAWVSLHHGATPPPGTTVDACLASYEQASQAVNSNPGLTASDKEAQNVILTKQYNCCEGNGSYNPNTDSCVPNVT